VHPHFADWHRLVEIDPRVEDLESRWGVIESVVTALTADDAISMVAVAHGAAPFSSAWPREFAQAFKDVDATFPMIDNAALISMLAAAAAIHAMSKADHVADLVAYAVTASAAVGREPAVDDLLAEASRYLTDEGIGQREPDAAPQALKISNTTPKALKDAVEAAPHATNAELVDHKAFVAVINQVVSTINSVGSTAAAHATQTVAWAENAVRPLREELNMLWWLLSGRSSMAGRPWNELDAGAAAVTAGWELADQVTVMPGPPVATELLRQLLTITFGTEVPAVSVAEAIAKLPELQSGPRPIEAMVDLTPLVSEAAGRQSPADSSDAHPLIELASRAHTEALLLRAYEAASS
jgi:hypothetical protein